MPRSDVLIDSVTPRHERANLWVICAAQFLTLGGMTAVLPLIPLYLQQIGVSDPEALKIPGDRLCTVCRGGIRPPLWGMLDRFGYKPMVVRSVSTAFATIGGVRGPLALLAGAASGCRERRVPRRGGPGLGLHQAR